MRTTEDWIKRMAELPLTVPRPDRDEIHAAWEEARAERRFEAP